MKLLLNLLIMFALLSRAYAAGADGLGAIAHTHVAPTPAVPALHVLPSAHGDVASGKLLHRGHGRLHPQSRRPLATNRPHEHPHADSSATRSDPPALPTAHGDAVSTVLSGMGHGHLHPRGDWRSTMNRPHEHEMRPMKAIHSHSHPASNHQHDKNAAGVVYVAEDDSASAASEALANLRALDGFVFLVAEPAVRARVSGSARLLVRGNSNFESRVPDPAERPPDR